MDDGYYTNTSGAAAALAIFLIIIGITLALALVFYVITAFALMTFFRKVGVSPWIAWVPFYSTWKWLEVGGMKGWWALIALIPYGSIVSSIFLYIGMYRTGIAFRKGTGFLVLGIFFPFVWAFILGSRDEVYEPQLITQAGFPPPRAGYGSIPPGAPYTASGYAQGGYAPYPGPPTAGAPAGYGAPQYTAPAPYAAAPGYAPPAAGYAAPPAYTPPPAYSAPSVPGDGAPVAPGAPAEPVAPAPQAPPTNVVPPIPPIPPAN